MDWVTCICKTGETETRHRATVSCLLEIEKKVRQNCNGSSEISIGITLQNATIFF